MTARYTGGADLPTLEGVVADIHDKAAGLESSPEAAAVTTVHALQGLIASLTMHFGVPSLPSLRCALEKVRLSHEDYQFYQFYHCKTPSEHKASRMLFVFWYRCLFPLQDIPKHTKQ